MHTTLILGIGNNLLTDEGLGVHVVRYLEEHHPDTAGVTFLDGGTLSFTLAEPIAEHDNLIVVDAARFGEPAGTIRCLEGEQMDRYLTGNRASVHEVGLMDLFDISRLSGTFPVHRALIGVEPASLGWGDFPSEKVAPTIAPVAAMALQLALRWRH
ncbi:MAG: HyaD/HybD family hydrogenase maturation endopeptidase [Chromatiaceae bacterium]|jgi:hydrogenase maturation protease|nr:HyaD/HybD family hydrogenase maturation endopeptidase [Chromatiaceae bacterium]